jgi:hypothetical protein
MGPIDPLDFLGPQPFRYENHLFGVLDFLGFPWILSSESSFFNGLHRIFVGNVFLAVFPLKTRGTGERTV